MSNVIDFEARTSVEHQAREWLVLMDGDEPLSSAQTAALREWIQRSVLHREELQRLCKFWQQANVLNELAVGLKSATASPDDSRWRWMPALALAVTAVLATAMLGWWYLQPLIGMSHRSYRTLVGQQKSITLADGSSIDMNTDSRLEVRYSGDSREVYLLKGEALFSVMPDSRRPFEVYAADRVVRAVGTAFDVHLEGTKVDVTVTKGVVDVVEVSQQNNVVHPEAIKERAPRISKLRRLKAGERTRISGDNDPIEVQQLAEPELQRKLAWQEGYLAFSGEPLSEVVEQVNRYSPVALEIGDPKLASIAIGGRFRVGDLDGVLEVLESEFGIQARRVGAQQVVLEGRGRR